MTCCWRPTPVSDSSSWMSSSRQGTPLMAYSLSPLRNSVRVIVTSVNSIGSSPAELSIGERHLGPAERRALGRAGEDDVVHLLAAHRARRLGAEHPADGVDDVGLARLPFGPTTTVTPGSSSSVVVSAKDLKPLRVSVLRNIAWRRYVPTSRAVPHDCGCAPTRRCAVPARLRQTWQCGQKKVERLLELDPDDRRPAPAAGLALAVVDLVLRLVVARPADEVDVLLVRQRRAPVLDGLVQHLDQRPVQPPDLLGRQRRRTCGRSAARPRRGSRRCRCCRCPAMKRLVHEQRS